MPRLGLTMKTVAGGAEVPRDERQQRPVVGVVENDTSLRRALRRLLRTGGFRVEAFSSAEAFLASGQPERVDCLVLDVRLGGMSGLDLPEWLVTTGSEIPVVFVTAHDDPATRERASRAGAVDYLPKPFEDASLMGAVDRAIYHR